MLRKHERPVAKNKYQSPKYRRVVGFTNKFVICQIAYSLIDDGNFILAQANSNKLAHYGLEVGLKNYAAAYCTRLLVARCLLQKVGLDEVYEGNSEVDAKVRLTTSVRLMRRSVPSVPFWM